VQFNVSECSIEDSLDGAQGSKQYIAFRYVRIYTSRVYALLTFAAEL
jgi:hypothetical protein